MINAGRFDASALHIAHALKQTEIQKSYNKRREKPIEEYLVSFYFKLKLKEWENVCLMQDHLLLLLLLLL
jgi:hypothetical protein